MARRPARTPEVRPGSYCPAAESSARRAARIASAERSMSASVVDQFETEMRMAC